jgi:hypothetical protein
MGKVRKSGVLDIFYLCIRCCIFCKLTLFIETSVGFCIVDSRQLKMVSKKFPRFILVLKFQLSLSVAYSGLGSIPG